jgi:hypothetical protein
MLQPHLFKSSIADSSQLQVELTNEFPEPPDFVNRIENNNSSKYNNHPPMSLVKSVELQMSLLKMNNHHPTSYPTKQSQDELMMVQEGETPVSSLCSVLDWNNSFEVENYATKQSIMLREEKLERISEYFGSLELSRLNENEKPDERIKQLFEEGLGTRVRLT